MPRLLAFTLAAACACAQVRRIGIDDLPVELRTLDLAAIHADSLRRVAEGERDHMIYFAMQSERFTPLPRVEPSVSARSFVESGAIPVDAGARLEAFFGATPASERHRYFRALVSSRSELDADYRRAMRFLHEKEWRSRSRQGAARRDYVTALYRARAHSTDSNAANNYAVHSALASLTQTGIERVLIVGPGMDIAPRTGLDDEDPPQSLQPYLVLDSLVRLGLSRLDTVQVDCADINPRVVRHLRSFAGSSRHLRLRVGLGDEEWNRLFAEAGRAIGVRSGKGLIEVSPAAARRVTAFEMNVLTERPSPGAYDLAIATNVLLYFNDAELGLALANIASSLRPGGMFIHNDSRAEVEKWGQVTGLPVSGARMVRLAAPAGRELYDSAILHTRQ